MPLPFIGALALGKAAGALKSVPWQVWTIGVLIVAVGLGKCAHDRQIKAFGRAQFTLGVNAEKEATNKLLAKAHADALAWKAKAEANAAAITQDIRGRHEATLRDTGARADALRLRGPGAARCRSGDHPGVPGAAGGREPAGGAANDARPRMPEQDGAGVQWGWLVDRAEQCDANRSEALSWREWHARQSAAIGVTP